MKKLISTQYSPFAFNLATFILRVGCGVLMIPYGYDKLAHFAKYKTSFMDFLGMGSTLSLALVVFAEFFCSIFLVMGLFTRLVAGILLIEMAVVVVKAHDMDIFQGKAEHGMQYLIGYIAIILLGAGKASLDGILGK